jgi:hypothetical protein
VPKQRKAPAAIQNIKERFHLGRRSLFLLLAAAVLAFGLTNWWPQEKHSTDRTLMEIVAAHDGFDLSEKPDHPGPYKELGVCRAGIGEPVFGSYWAAGKNCRFHIPAVPGEELQVVGLLPQDGSGPTYVVLKRHAVPLPPARESKK